MVFERGTVISILYDHVDDKITQRMAWKIV